MRREGGASEVEAETAEAEAEGAGAEKVARERLRAEMSLGSRVGVVRM